MEYLNGTSVLHGLTTLFHEAVADPVSVLKLQSPAVSADPLLGSVVICAIVWTVCWLLSIITGNYSQVDRLWSVLPFAYSWWFTLFGSFIEVANPRLLLISILTTSWGLRLSYNFYRKGGYNPKDEDYR